MKVSANVIVEIPNKWDRHLRSPADCIAAVSPHSIESRNLRDELSNTKYSTPTSEGGYDARELVEFRQVPVVFDVAIQDILGEFINSLGLLSSTQILDLLRAIRDCGLNERLSEDYIDLRVDIRFYDKTDPRFKAPPPIVNSNIPLENVFSEKEG